MKNFNMKKIHHICNWLLSSSPKRQVTTFIGWHKKSNFSNYGMMWEVELVVRGVGLIISSNNVNAYYQCYF